MRPTLLPDTFRSELIDIPSFNDEESAGFWNRSTKALRSGEPGGRWCTEISWRSQVRRNALNSGPPSTTTSFRAILASRWDGRTSCLRNRAAAEAFFLPARTLAQPGDRAPSTAEYCRTFPTLFRWPRASCRGRPAHRRAPMTGRASTGRILLMTFSSGKAAGDGRGWSWSDS